MKFAPVCPIHVYEYLYQLGPECIGDYFLLLAHDVLANQQRYADFFKQLAKERPITIIMDNSVIELGNACDKKTLLEAAATVDATCLAIPDVLCDGSATFERAREFLGSFSATELNLLSHGLMYIPQGHDLADFSFCLNKGLDEFGYAIQWIGIPRNVTGRIIPSRKHLTGMVWGATQRISVGRPKPKIHLLGFCDNAQDDIETAVLWNGYVEGIDSAVPLRLGTQGVHLMQPEHLIDPGPRGDWWETVQVTSPSYLGVNTLTVRTWIGELLAG